MPCDKTPREYNHPTRSELNGWMVEDVWIDTYPTWEPHLQAFKHQRGDLSLRYCYYEKDSNGQRGQFVGLPSFAYDHTIDALRDEVKKHNALIIQTLLKRFIEV